MAFYNPQLTLASGSAPFNYETTPFPTLPAYAHRVPAAGQVTPEDSRPSAWMDLHVAINSAYTCRDCNIPLRPHRTSATQRCSINIVRNGTKPTAQEIADFDFTLVLYTADNRPHGHLFLKHEMGGLSLQFAPTRENPNNYFFTLLNAGDRQNISHHAFGFVQERQPDGDVVVFRSFEFDCHVRVQVTPGNSAAILHRFPDTMQDNVQAYRLGDPTMHSGHWQFPAGLITTTIGQSEALIVMASIIVFSGLHQY
ncbi:hypothetical protein HMN09_00403200 [Mycena chlorophos]|uniref:Uncharacterized protein n=1 Tax=Mycena chlorophos TaxID=658473 RepID=A0A8H6TG38_MYCCL|nr:hypothetical protein HMN09_00403200 [Mycena chlorophos]